MAIIMGQVLVTLNNVNLKVTDWVYSEIVKHRPVKLYHISHLHANIRHRKLVTGNKHAKKTCGYRVLQT